MGTASNRLDRNPPIRRLYRRASRLVLPGFGGMSLAATARLFLQELRNIRLSERSAAVTYSFLLAIPPSLLFFCSLVPYLPLKGVQETLLSSLRVISPNDNSYNRLAAVVTDFLQNERRDILSFGILLTLFFSSNGMMGLMRSFDRQTKVYVHRSGLRRRWTAIKLTVLLLVVALVSVAAVVLQSTFINEWLLRVLGTVWVVKLFSLLLLLGLVFVVISSLYTYGPSLTHRFPFVSPGSVLATVLCVGLSAGFFFAVNNVIQYNKVYGSIGTLIAFMVWVWLNVMVILVGFELNVSILIGKTERNHGTGEKSAA